MRILQVHTMNYKSIANKEEQELLIHDNFNILAGRNNAGKTALLEAIANVCKCSQIHDTIPPNFHKYSFNRRRIILKQEGAYLLNLTLELTSNEAHTLFYRTATENKVPKFLNVILVIKENIIIGYEVYYSVIEPLNTALQPLSATILKHSPLFEGNPEDYSTSDAEKIKSFKQAFLAKLQNSIVFISVNRKINSPSFIKPTIDLDSDASNLHTVLYTLRNNEGKLFDEIQKQFTLMFPDVARIHTYIDYNEVERENSTQVLLEFENLRNIIPLEECGSGYTQALLLLCLVYSKKRRIILFDEPHTYLHPHAEKSIYDLAVVNKRHQYIFSTHSPILINYPVEKKVYFVKKELGSSCYIEMTNIHEVLDDLGVSNSDFSFSDRVIFVEGPTEENILPLIFEQNDFKQVGFNYKIISLNGTDREFSKRSAMANNSDKLESIFNAISHSPIPYKIMLDKDEKTPDKIKELEENYKGKVVILPRREIENYFLVAEAIHSLIKNYSPTQEIKIADIQESIQICLDDQTNKTFYPKGCNTPIEDVKASKILEEVLNKYSIRYNKIRDGLYIAEWLYQNGYRVLDEVYQFFADFLHNREMVISTP
ncbi:TPA: ATP-dependent nuclease [Bacillus thuringiensis]